MAETDNQNANVRSLFGLEGKRIIVVGGGEGMGKATVRLLSSLGCDIAVVDLDKERAERVAGYAAKHGVVALPVCLNVTDEADVAAAFAHIERELGPIDGMATIVGMAAWSPIVDMTADTWDLDHGRNLRYFFLVARELARSLLRRGAPGSIVAISSVDGVRSAPNHAAYGAAKAGLNNLVKSMAVEWAGNGIRVNAVAPGAIVTPRLPLGDEESERRGMASLPMKRRGSVEDIAKAVAFFLSDLSPYVTGQTLAVDGGYTSVGVFSHKRSLPSQDNHGDQKSRT